mgnify:CR=1 FL=1
MTLAWERLTWKAGALDTRGQLTGLPLSWVDALATPEGVWRRSIAMYYYTTTRPEDELREPHNTRYKGMHLP